MKRQEQLQEAYEDALFTLLMNHVAEVYGKQALQENRALREDSDAEVPQDIHRACLKAINRTFRKKNARTAGRTTVRILKTVALVALLGALALSAAFAAFPELRAGTLNMLFDSINDDIKFQFSSQPITSWTCLDDICPSIVPTEYKLVDENNFAGAYWAYYQNEQGDRLDINLSTQGRFDTEGAKLESIRISGLPAYIIDQTNLEGDSHGIIKVIILNEEEGYVLSVMSIPHSSTIPAPISRESIIRIAESIFE